MLRLTVCMCATGQGGNDLLGNRKQTGHQELVRGNLALVSDHPYFTGCEMQAAQANAKAFRAISLVHPCVECSAYCTCTV